MEEECNLNEVILAHRHTSKVVGEPVDGQEDEVLHIPRREGAELVGLHTVIVRVVVFFTITSEGMYMALLLYAL